MFHRVAPLGWSSMTLHHLTRGASVAGVAAVLLTVAACGRAEGPRVDFAVTHTDLMEHRESGPVTLPPEPATVDGAAGAVQAHGLIAAPDACDDLGARLEPGDSALTLRVIVRGSRGHLGGCGGVAKVALIQWRARIGPLGAGAYRVRVLYDFRGLDSHLRAEEQGTRGMYQDRVVAETSVKVR